MKKSSKQTSKKRQPRSTSRRLSTQPVSTRRGRPPLEEKRKPSQIPLRDDEHDRLFAAARALGLPYATWARTTLLVVAGWPVEKQPANIMETPVLEISSHEVLLKKIEEVVANDEHRSDESKARVTVLLRGLFQKVTGGVS